MHVNARVNEHPSSQIFLHLLVSQPISLIDKTLFNGSRAAITRKQHNPDSSFQFHSLLQRDELKQTDHFITCMRQRHFT